MVDAVDRAARRYGQAARLGLIVPTTNTVNEAEWAACLPASVTMHVARMALHLETAGLEQDLAAAARSLADAAVDVIGYGCTAGSLVLPLGTVPDMIHAATGLPGIATAPAIVHALRALGAVRIAVGTPYDERLNRHERDFFEACGLEVVAMEGLGAGDPAAFRGIHRLPAQTVQSLACRVARGADALVLSCTDLPTLDLHAGLERRLGMPVVTSNMATLWAALREAGLDGPARWQRQPRVNAPGSAQTRSA